MDLYDGSIHDFTATVAVAKQYDHSKGDGGNGGNSNTTSSGSGNTPKKKKIVADGKHISGKEDPNGRTYYNLDSIASKGYREYVSQNICENCHEVGHMGHTCKHSETTNAMRDASRERRDKRRKEKEEQGGYY